MAIVVRNEGAKVNSNINVTPMVDVMLVLLIVSWSSPNAAKQGEYRAGQSHRPDLDARRR